MLHNWKDKKIAVLGLGTEGLATAEFLLDRDLKFTILDQKSEKELEEVYGQSLQELKERGVQGVYGENYLNNLENFDIIIRSPGIRVLRRELIEVQKRGSLLTSHTQIFFDLCPCPIIGVTGTKGKGTTATLIYEMLKTAGKEAYLGGNIGIAPLDFLGELTSESWVVLELSSFQLQDAEKSPHIAVMLMVTSDHLDYHSTVEEY